MIQKALLGIFIVYYFVNNISICWAYKVKEEEARLESESNLGTILSCFLRDIKGCSGEIEFVSKVGKQVVVVAAS